MGRMLHCPIFVSPPSGPLGPDPFQTVTPGHLPHPMNTTTDSALLQVERLMLRLMLGLVRVAAGTGVSATLRAARYHLEAGGQRVRARLALHACEALGVVGDQAVRLAACVELLHNASLVHDDLQDKEKLRRGLPTVCAAFGPDVALCTGDLLLSAAYGGAHGRKTAAEFLLILEVIVDQRGVVEEFDAGGEADRLVADDTEGLTGMQGQPGAHSLAAGFEVIAGGAQRGGHAGPRRHPDKPKHQT